MSNKASRVRESDIGRCDSTPNRIFKETPVNRAERRQAAQILKQQKRDARKG